MKKIYEADSEDKDMILSVDNDLSAFDKARRDPVSISDIVMITRLGNAIYNKENNNFQNIKNSIEQTQSYKSNYTNNNSVIDCVWSLNGIEKLPENNSNNVIEKIDENKLLVFDPLVNHLDDNFENISANNTSFKEPIELSKDAIILMPEELYDLYYNRMVNNGNNDCAKSDNNTVMNINSTSTKSFENNATFEFLKKHNSQIRLYEGNEKLAIKMLMRDLRYTYINMDKSGYIIDQKNHPDIIEFTNKMNDLINSLNEQIKKGKKLSDVYSNILTENLRSKLINEEEKNDQANLKNQANEDSEKSEQKDSKNRSDKDVNNSQQLSTKNNSTETSKKREQQTSENYAMITGLTSKVEGEISLEDGFSASTDIGKYRKNQEDAVLLIKDKENPNLKMMVVADGMGGLSRGELASNAIVKELKNWFENLSELQKDAFYNSTERARYTLLNEIEFELQPLVQWETMQQGGSTLVCAIIGKDDTLVANVGDSRAYIVKDNKLIQVSREDTVAQSNLEKGHTPDKEASRFDEESNILLQDIGMDRNMLKEPFVKVIKNSDYDMLLLFTDGVTDCLSDDDIVAVCKNTDIKNLSKKITEKAISHDSILPEEYSNYTGLNIYIPGGKDNATTAVYSRRKQDENEK